MSDNFARKVVPGGESAGLFDAACNTVRDMTQARCAVVIVVDGAAGSGYSVIGPLDAQVFPPDILQQIADALRGQLVCGPSSTNGQ
ncbi:hypothetical protein PQQ53_34705 [Paraburkholderia strydomiana]|jgi:hypothetical protein|uniref:Uncharacterized protein n=1 Tax=Paraburkholderia strydomiana TaxID=1245417 RepID=A0ABW9EGF8_9BURK